MRIIISGGGTGGHVFPAIAIADELKQIDPKIEILFVGAKGKIEMEKVPKAGYPIKGLWISGLQRKLTIGNLMFPFKLIHSLWKAFWIVRKFKPDVAVGVGGFASGPTLAVANWLSVPTLLQEQNSYAGVTNKLLSKKANTICVAYEKMERYFPAGKIVLTGNPVRKDIIHRNVNREEGIRHFGLDSNKKTIVIIGGSLGARSINRGMRASFELLKKQGEVQVLWQSGKLYIEEYAISETANLPNIKISAFIDRMDLAYAMADVVIGRAGASTISELCIVGKATILVPSPNVAEDHQTKNAMALVEAAAAILVKDKEVNDKMIQSALEVLGDKNIQQRLEKNILKLGKPGAAEAIAREVLKLGSITR
ncbi:MAG: UDP-N-acetylglucosamine--N-acetylmuramyl-(pentapeptide) pyrophosphoryl-undecaprenol N-acetylglucosamine transferase [Saprospiraceae bacterium]|jgi:UDP-N-acetylglucosamine--N-acetylmuramyl-(pentapeptide) pyrophosphoryl-undecaprenol N-acetylglucosamine transferase